MNVAGGAFANSEKLQNQWSRAEGGRVLWVLWRLIVNPRPKKDHKTNQFANRFSNTMSGLLTTKGGENVLGRVG